MTWDIPTNVNVEEPTEGSMWYNVNIDFDGMPLADFPFVLSLPAGKYPRLAKQNEDSPYYKFNEYEFSVTDLIKKDADYKQLQEFYNYISAQIDELVDWEEVKFKPLFREFNTRTGTKSKLLKFKWAKPAKTVRGFIKEVGTEDYDEFTIEQFEQYCKNNVDLSVSLLPNVWVQKRDDEVHAGITFTLSTFTVTKK